MLKKWSLCLPLLLSGCGPAIVGGVGTLGMSAVEDRGIGGVASDQALRVKLNWALSDEPFDFTGLELTIYKGRVLLTGVIADERAKTEAVRIVKYTSGVKEVIDRMNVKGEDSFSEYARDGWITTKLKATLYSDEDVIAPNYLATTFDKVIYVFGTAQTKEEMQRVVDHAYDITGVRKVENFIEVRQAPQ